jgi:hypothetical protein
MIAQNLSLTEIVGHKNPANPSRWLDAPQPLLLQGTHITEVIRASRRAGNGKTVPFKRSAYGRPQRRGISCGHVKLALCKNPGFKVMDSLI